MENKNLCPGPVPDVEWIPVKGLEQGLAQNKSSKSFSHCWSILLLIAEQTLTKLGNNLPVDFVFEKNNPPDLASLVSFKKAACSLHLPFPPSSTALFLSRYIQSVAVKEGGVCVCLCTRAP